MKKTLVGLLVLWCLGTVTANADMYYWTNWGTPTYGTPGSATGTITLPSGTINVTYSGEVLNKSDKGDWNFPNTYSKPGVVDNVPTPYKVSIPLVGGNSIVDTITFSTPVLNPVLAIQSVGSPSDRSVYDFASPFTIVQQGPGHWGGSTTSLSQSGNYLRGFEGNGILLFEGVFNSISWTVTDGENYHMFTVGAPAAVPLPGAVLLGGLGLSVAGWRLRRKTA